jgi:hypothetical protein
MLNGVDGQFELLPRPKPQEHVPDEIVKKLQSMSAAINLSILSAGMEPKEAYMALDIDKGVWSRILMNQANFPHEKYTTLEDVTGNDIPLRWLALRKNRELKPMKSALEEQNEKLKTENTELRKENELLRGLITGRMK